MQASTNAHHTMWFFHTLISIGTVGTDSPHLDFQKWLSALKYASLIFSPHSRFQITPKSNYFACGSGGEVWWWARLCVSVCVCVFVCLSPSISLQVHARSLPIFLCMLLMAVAQSSAGRVTRSQGEGAVLGVVRDIRQRWQSSLQTSLPHLLQKGSLDH